MVDTNYLSYYKSCTVNKYNIRSNRRGGGGEPLR